MINKEHNWHDLHLFLSTSSTQKYLQDNYKLLGITEYEKFSFQNCHSFMYYIEHAETYYKQANLSSISLKPILLFYGYIQLLKACILTLDPTYPNSTSLLAHGVSTRKKKKQQYEFIHDEVKIQKNGLFSYISEKMFHMKHLEGNKVTMSDLFHEIPELHNYLTYYNQTKSTILIKNSNLEYIAASKILDYYHLTPIRLEEYFNSQFQIKLALKEENKKLLFLLEKPFSINYNYPFRYHMFSGNFHLSSNKESTCFSFSEIMIHYLLLYNLSMVARYETEWWLDLIKTTPNNDYPLIEFFLENTQIKGPFLITKWLFEEKNNLI